MTCTISENISQQEWETFLLASPLPPFLQSWYMRDVHTAIGQEVLCVGIREEESLVGIALAILVRAKRGSYLYLPYGPVFRDSTAWKQYFSPLTDYLAQKGKEYGMDFMRSSPFSEVGDFSQTLYKTAGWKQAPIHVLAEHLWLLDIRPSQEELLKGMRKTMRNLIRRAEKDGVTIHQGNDDADVEQFIAIHKDTVQRHKFTPYSDAYFLNQVRAFRSTNNVELFHARYQEKTIASAIIMFYGNMASYHHGASLSEYQKIPSSYLLQWTAIQEAKKRECETYNFWGVVPKEQEYSRFLKRKHPFIGVTTFKMGFGGYPYNLLHCQDYPLTKKYTFFTTPIEVTRRIKRGFFYS